MTIRTVATLTAAMVASTMAISSAVAHDHDHMGGSGMMAKMDTNHDGSISAAEHAAYAKAMFDKMDTNHDGMLSKDEIKAGKKAIREERDGQDDKDEHETHENP